MASRRRGPESDGTGIYTCRHITVRDLVVGGVILRARVAGFCNGPNPTPGLHCPTPRVSGADDLLDIVTQYRKYKLHVCNREFNALPRGTI